jgi:catechol 2,3-dioxygenase-like lactoylglutathione lyase family enzyme
MGIERLDHVNVVTPQLEKMVKWYSDVLGLSVGPRPAFPFPGAWLYAGERPVVHLVDSADTKVGAEVALKLEHFAFAASDMAAFEATLSAHNQPFEKSTVAGTTLTQFHIADPDGNHIHVDFDARAE